MGSKSTKEEEKPKEEIIEKEKIVYKPLPEKNIKLVKANSMDFKTLDEEEKFLMEHKNEVLQTQLNQVRKKFETVKSLDQVIDFKDKKDEGINNKFLLEIEDDEKYCCCEYKTFLKFNFNFIGILFVIFNLIGVYQLIGILKATEKEISFGIQSFLFEKNRTANNNNINSTNPNNTNNNKDTNNLSFENIYENYYFKTIPDFSLLFLSSILGNLILKLFGFRFTTIIYMIINVLALFIFESFDFPEKYNFYQISLLLLYYLIFFISVGSITLLSHQIYFDGLTKYIRYKTSHTKINIEKIEEKETKAENNKDNLIEENIYDKENNNIKKENENNDKISFFSYLCLTEIPAYLIYFGINYFFHENNYYDYFFMINIIIYVSFTVFSLLFYICYSKIFIKEKNNNKKNIKEINVYRILGYLIYYEKKYQEDNRKKNIDIKNSVDNIDSINNTNNIIKINDEDENEVNIYEPPCCYWCRLGHRKCRLKANTLFSILFGLCFSILWNCAFICCCFCCCCEFEEWQHCCECNDLSEVNQGDEQFCFCYKVQGKYSWFCDLLFKNDILTYIEFDIVLEIITIGFSQKINENLKENNINENFITLIIYLIIFVISASINRLESEECKAKFIKAIKAKFAKEEIEHQKQNVSIIVLVNIFLVILFSGFSYFGSDNLRNFTDKYLIIIPFTLTKFYNFILLNCLINIIDYGNIDLLSNSAIVSLFLILYKIFAFIITDIINCSIEGLILFQFIFCLIVVGILIVALILAAISLAILWVIIKMICACCCKKDN